MIKDISIQFKKMYKGKRIDVDHPRYPNTNWKASFRLDGKPMHRSVPWIYSEEQAGRALKFLLFGQGALEPDFTSGGYTYLIHAISSDRYKIGYSRNPPDRLTKMQTGSPLELALIAAIPSHQPTETQLHIEFKEYRALGEWFDFPDPNVVLKRFGEWNAEKFHAYFSTRNLAGMREAMRNVKGLPDV